jgi:hypothetical protein
MKKLTKEKAIEIIQLDEEIRYTSLLYNATRDDKLLAILKKVKQKKQAIYDHA